jgi:hypothetical protein
LTIWRPTQWLRLVVNSHGSHARLSRNRRKSHEG